MESLLLGARRFSSLLDDDPWLTLGKGQLVAS